MKQKKYETEIWNVHLDLGYTPGGQMDIINFMENLKLHYNQCLKGIRTTIYLKMGNKLSQYLLSVIS